MPTGDQIVLQKGEQDVAAAVQDRADLEKIEEKRLKAGRRRMGTAQPGDKAAEEEDAAGDQEHDQDGFEPFAALLGSAAGQSCRHPANEDHAQGVGGNPIREEIVPICRELSSVRLERGGKKTYNNMIACYFLDLAQTWRALRRVCASPSEVCFVIGTPRPMASYVPMTKQTSEGEAQLDAAL